MSNRSRLAPLRILALGILLGAALYLAYLVFGASR